VPNVSWDSARVFRVFPEAVSGSLREPMLRYAWKGFRVLTLPVMAAEQSLGLTAQPRIALLRATPTVPQVVANYTRGLTLFGRRHTRLTTFEWRSFPLRGVITREMAKVPKTVRAQQQRTDLEVKFDEDFENIIHLCQVGRNGWIWLTPALVDIYREVNRQGFVSTVGVYQNAELVAGIWGISVGRVLGIMSMFHSVDNAGSLALAAIVDTVSTGGRWSVVDCGVPKPHFEMYGAKAIPQERFCELVWETLR
jgi:leucyl/phenylalanyl-tRNA--protein transferase